MKRLDWRTVLMTIVIVFALVGLIALIMAIRQLTRPLAEVGETWERELGGIVHPTPTIIPDPVVIVHEMRSLSRLETASYTIEKVITAESGQGPLGFLFGDQLILVAHGQVIAGVDLEQMEEDDILVTEDGTVYIALPEAEIFTTALDSEQTYVFDRDTGLIGLNPDLETEARRAAEEQIEQAALEDGILEMAQRNAEAYMQRLVLSLGFSQVVFVDALPTPVPFSTP